MFDAIDAGLIVIGDGGRILAWNDWIAGASGIAAEQAVGRELDEVFPHLAGGRLPAAIGEAQQNGISSVLTHSLHRSMLPLKTRAGRDLVHNIAVRPLGVAGTCIVHVTDVTLATDRDRILRDRQNARYDAVVDSASDAIITLDASGAIQLANPAAAQEFGYDASELIGQNFELLFRGGGVWAEIWAQLWSGKVLTRTVELIAWRKDGSPSYVEISASRWRSDARYFVTAILRDVNERRAAEDALRALNQTLEARVAERTAELLKAEEALRQSQKMEALGQLTGGIAHDFNNLLTGIIGAMDVLKRRVAAHRYDDVERFMDAAVTSAKRAAALTHRLLAFARRQPLDPQPLDANQLIQNMEELLRRSIGEQVSLRTELSADPWPALTDANQLENALLNLVINARDAMPHGGTITIRTGSHTQAANTSPEKAGEEPIAAGDYTVISVSDTGTGMSPETLARAFDPFFTTKPIGQGTGLGLSMIYGFAKQSRGHVRIESAPRQGTTVRLYLPRHLGSAVERIVPTAPAPAPQGAGETVLLVEDDSSVRLLISEVLRELGYASLEASDGQAALPMLESNARLDLMITDVGLPGLNGRQLAEIARQHRPDLKVLFVTGYAEHATERGEFLAPGMEMVTKPFDLEVLAIKIRQMIETRRP
ncbi:PAS domain S-box protein [Roseiterribacter gracilis]|uniref:hybrid sensor histidine kinase/response regulator n=1 Tax=Roseiterribacter gracilis TaxID=2812848 RepID=UPI003B43CA2E